MGFSIDDAHEYLNSLLVFGVKLGLQNMETMCKLLGDPQNDLEFVHVAGTNGKGSTCSMLAAAFKNCGLKTAFYSSPFLYRFTERWRVNGLEVSEQEVADAIKQIESIEDDLVEGTGVRPTYFEVLTAAALLIFKAREVDIVVWETGLGGRLDATNVVTPLVSVITNIGLDHTQYLGDTILDIAYEKGGIVKEGIPFICGDKDEEVLGYYEKISKERNAPLYSTKDFSVHSGELRRVDHFVSRSVIFESPAHSLNFKINDPSVYQVQNAGVAVAVLEKVSELKGLDFSKLISGLEAFRWPGRLEIRQDGFILDGAHNPMGARAAVDSLKEISPGKKFDFVCGILKDKEWQTVIDVFAEVADSFYFVTLDNERTSDAGDLRDYAESLGVNVLGCGGSEDALAQIKRPSQTIAVGSLYLIGELLSRLNCGEPLKVDNLA